MRIMIDTKTEVQHLAEATLGDAENLRSALTGEWESGALRNQIAEDYGLDPGGWDWLDLLEAMALEVYGTSYTNRDGLVAVTVVTGTGGPHTEFTVDEAGRCKATATWGSETANVSAYVPDLFRELEEIVVFRF